MKKLLLILVSVFSTCSCSNMTIDDVAPIVAGISNALDEYTESQNQMAQAYLSAAGLPQYYYQPVDNHYLDEVDPPEVQFQRGLLYLRGSGGYPNYQKAVYWFLLAAQKGHIGAQYTLGEMFYNGYGVQQDFAKAFYFFELAAKQGYAEAQFIVGCMCQNGQGVPRDSYRAAGWFERAAYQGHAKAQYNLGIMYARGDGVIQNTEMAIRWINTSCLSGFADGCYLKSQIESM